jgi:hypothetical protein
MTTLLRTGVLVLGLMALTAPSFAQTSGDAGAPTGTEEPKNLPPKGDIGTDREPDLASPGMRSLDDNASETTGAGSTLVNPMAPRAKDESERNMPPRGNIGDSK